MIPFVQIRVDLGGRNGIPHTFIAVAHPDGMVTEYGLVPANGFAAGPGMIEISGSREQEVESRKDPIREESMNIINSHPGFPCPTKNTRTS